MAVSSVSQGHRDPGGAAGEDVEVRVTEGANEPKASVPSVAVSIPEAGTALAAVEGTSNAKNEAVAELVELGKHAVVLTHVFGHGVDGAEVGLRPVARVIFAFKLGSAGAL